MKPETLCFVGFATLIASLPSAACVDIPDEGARLTCFDEMTRCAAIRDDEKRLSCFDRELGATGTPSGSAAPESEPGSPVAPPAAPPVQTSTAPPSAPAPAAISQAERDFGRARQEVDQITSSIDGTFDGWEGRTRFKLANGQIWEVRRRNSLRSYRAVENPEVIVRKNGMGFYIMEVPSVNARVPVTRVD